ncbi:hypothetical protein, partial [Enterococcus faecium]
KWLFCCLKKATYRKEKSREKKKKVVPPKKEGGHEKKQNGGGWKRGKGFWGEGENLSGGSGPRELENFASPFWVEWNSFYE